MSTLAFLSGSVLSSSAKTQSAPPPPPNSGWLSLIIPYCRSGHSKPTTALSRSNQELALKRLWRGALHSPGGGVCCILRQIFTHYVQKSGPGCLAAWKRQVSFYLMTAPRNTGGWRSINHIHISLKLGINLSVWGVEALTDACKLRMLCTIPTDYRQTSSQLPVKLIE